MINWLTDNYQILEDFFRQGGPLMIPLAGVSLIMWLLITERAIFVWQLSRHNMDLQTAADHIHSGHSPDSELYRGVISLLVSRFQEIRSGDSHLDCYILDESVLTINHSLRAHLNIIAVLAAVSPLFGLLGTVTGMITTFDVLALFGTGNSRAMAGGISEALITTQTGLLVAIPGLYMHNFLSHRIEKLQQRVAVAGLYLRRQMPGSESKIAHSIEQQCPGDSSDA